MEIRQPHPWHILRDLPVQIASGGTEVTFLGSPSIVQIETTPMMISSGCQVLADLGIWKTQLNSAHGKTSQV
jgi:hypothetical protein